MDDRPFRIAVVPGSEDRFAAAGWELPNQEAYDATLKALGAAGVAIEHGAAEEAADRKVRALARCKDPSGNRLEIITAEFWTTRRSSPPSASAVS